MSNSPEPMQEITQDSRWATRIEAVACITDYAHSQGRKTYQSSKSSGGEVILLCHGGKQPGTHCDFKVRIRKTKAKNTDSQLWYIPRLFSFLL